MDNPILSAFREGMALKAPPPYRDPMGDLYFGPTAPRWAKAAWSGLPYTSDNGRHVNPQEKADARKAAYAKEGIPDVVVGAGLDHSGWEIAAVAGKGSGKSFALGMAFCALIQRNPGIKIGICANTYAQAYGSGAEKLVKVANALGLEFIFRTEMIIDGVKHYNVYYFPEYDAKVCVLSFENIKFIEGTEWDAFWFEEIQDCKEKDVVTAISRLRRGTCPRCAGYAGMPDDENHWMYRFFEERGIALFEPATRENGNLPATYESDLRRMYRGTDVDRYIEGQRVSLFRMKVVPTYRHSLHTKSEAAERLAVYDPYRPLFIFADFNVAPMCWTAWQLKEWDFTQDGRVVRKPVAVQVDEWELWGASTQQMMEEVVASYGDHAQGITLVGDATGNRRDTRSPGETDYTIIKRVFSEGGVKDARVIEGLVMTRHEPKARKRGERLITYSNPPKRDQIACLNRLMIDGDGDPGVLFMYESKYPSGGAAQSVSSAKFGMDSGIDSTNDKNTTDQTLPRTHFLDTCFYMAWYFTGGMKQAKAASERGVLAGKIEMEIMKPFSTEGSRIIVPGQPNAGRFGAGF